MTEIEKLAQEMIDILARHHSMGTIPEFLESCPDVTFHVKSGLDIHDVVILTGLGVSTNYVVAIYCAREKVVVRSLDNTELPVYKSIPDKILGEIWAWGLHKYKDELDIYLKRGE